ncbi:MAG: phospholipid carrier-dependent glycosyltransferase, partial [Deltaproteobacteria bacterium]
MSYDGAPPATLENGPRVWQGSMKKREIGVCLFFAGSFIILFLNLWGRNLENHDYLRYAEVAKEMIQSGDWIVPRFNGEIFLHKPPFLFWLIALPSTIHGSVSPFLARLPSAFFAWLGAITVYLWGRKIWSGRRWGMVSAGILISSYLYFWQGRIARTDMVFSVLILLSLYFFHESYSVEDPSLSTLFSFLFMALAGLTKGPVGILFPLLIMFLFLLRRSQLKYFIRKDSIFGYFVAAVIPGVWVVLFLHQMGWEEALMAWQESEILSRQAPFYLYLTRVWVDFAPWSIFL